MFLIIARKVSLQFSFYQRFDLINFLNFNKSNHLKFNLRNSL